MGTEMVWTQSHQMMVGEIQETGYDCLGGEEAVVKIQINYVIINNRFLSLITIYDLTCCLYKGTFDW